MPKAMKERLKHASNLAVQLQGDRDPSVSNSGRAKRKRKAEEEKDDLEDGGDQVVDGKMGRRILAMAREQVEEEEEEDQVSEIGEEEHMQWRGINDQDEGDSDEEEEYADEEEYEEYEEEGEGV